jgi:hypothetical protein
MADPFGSFIQVRADRTTALDTASRTLVERGLKASEWRTVVQFLPNLDSAVFEYLRRQRGREQANQVVAERTATGVWRVNFFREQQKEEWYVYVNQSGRAYRTDHVLDEKAPGANLTLDQARRIAEDYLRSQQKIGIDQYRLVDSSSERRDRRTDHYFTWEDPRFRIGEATSRVSLTILGDEPSHYRPFIKLPEEWLREFQRVRIRAFLLPAVAGAVFLTALIVFIRRLAGHHFRWRLYSLLAVVALLLSAGSRLNRLPSFYANYDTAVPLQDYVGDAILSAFMTSLLVAFGVFLGALAMDVFLAFGLRARQKPRANPAVTASFAAILFGFPALVAGTAQWIPGDRLSLPLWSLPGADSLSPSFQVLVSALGEAFVICVLASVLVSLAIRLLSLRTLAVWIILVAISVALSAGGSPLLIAYYFVITLLFFAIAVLLCLTSPAAILSLAPAVFLVKAAEGAVALMSQPSPSLRLHGAASLLVAFVLVFLWHKLDLAAWRITPGEAADL